MFLGRYEHTIDEKGRLTIPVRFRELLVGGAFVTQGIEQNLNVLTVSEFDEMAQRVNMLSFTDPTARLLNRFIYSSAYQVEVDKAGRILIPQHLRQYAGLDVTAIVIGTGRHFEIWSPDQWNQQNALLVNPEYITQKFSDLDLSTH